MTMRDDVAELLLSSSGWISRQQLIEKTAFRRGYAALLGPAGGEGKPGNWKQLGLVEVEKRNGNVYYRVTDAGRQQLKVLKAEVDYGADEKYHEEEINRLLSEISTTGTAAVTYNTKPGSAKNFKRIGKSAKDGYWITRPAAPVTHGIHYENRAQQGPSEISIGTWKTAEGASGKWIFKLENVTGPLKTRRSFGELFGKGPQASFVYFPRNPQSELGSSKKTKTTSNKQDGLPTLLAKTLPGIPRTGSETDAVIKRRLGHGQLRKYVLALFGSTCCITGLKKARLLVCSHIRPWSQCDESGKVSPDNILLLAVNWDAAFDRGLITFDGRGRPELNSLDAADAKLLGLDMSLKLNDHYLTRERKAYLAWHRRLHLKGRRPLGDQDAS